ncbi:sex hormone-binding globulin [Larimichthys crocea]|uniref:sex hormone-binding globulin n=1 Tax=Larimichthys crocea TaxID=215358 RepID=UPI00054B07FD|nr:sex hormone-binding globulin [Larimichthys crocea]
MAVFWKAMAGGLLFALSLTLLGWGVEGQSKNKVSGSSAFYLGQERDIWRPLIQTAVNVSNIRSIKSTFQFHTFDPEGVIFYGDTKDGKDWFVLSLKDGLPLMQISKGDILLSVTGGNKLNDGKWHTLEVSNHGKFVILEVDGLKGLVVGMQSQQPEEALSGELRLALGGILIEKEKLIVEFEPRMDGCVREGNWLNLSVPWEAEVDNLWPCSGNVQPGSYFSGTGFSYFSASDFPVADDAVRVEFWGNFSKMDGTIMSLMAPGNKLMFSLVANSKEQELTVEFANGGAVGASLSIDFKRVAVIFHADSLEIHRYTAESRGGTSTVSLASHLMTLWREGRLAIGGLLGEAEDNVGSKFLRGCLERIQIQGKDLDLDTSVRHKSIIPHSCPL